MVRKATKTKAKEPVVLEPGEAETARALGQRRDAVMAETEAVLAGLQAGLLDLGQRIARRAGWPVKPTEGTYVIEPRPDGSMIMRVGDPPKEPDKEEKDGG